MIVIALNTIFNGFILGVMLLISNIFLHIHFLNNQHAFLLGYIISAILSIIGYTKIANTLIEIFIFGRKPITKEENRITPIIKEIIDKINKTFKTKCKQEDIAIKITDSNIINTQALGHNKIIISNGCLKHFNDNQLTAILSHEFAHLYYKDSIRSTSFLLGSCATRILIYIFTISIIIQTALVNIIKKMKNGVIFSILSCFPLLMFFPLIAFGWIGNKMFIILNAQLNKKNIYRADCFTVNLGYKNELIEALEIISNFKVESNTFKDKIMSSDIPVKLRIRAIEDEIMQKKYIENLNKNTTTPKTITANNKELLILTVYFIFIGIVLYLLLLR